MGKCRSASRPVAIMLLWERLPMRRGLALFKKEILGRTWPGRAVQFLLTLGHNKYLQGTSKQRKRKETSYISLTAIALPSPSPVISNFGAASIDRLLEVNSYIDLAADRTAGGRCVEEITATESGPEGSKPHRAKA